MPSNCLPLLLALTFPSQVPASAPSAGMPGSPLYDVLPDNTIVAVYTEKPSRAFPRKLLEPILNRLMPSQVLTQRTVRLLANLPGPIIVARVHSHPGKFEQDDLILLAREDTTGPDIDKLITEDILSLINDLESATSPGKSAGKLQLQHKGDARIILQGEKPLFTLGTRDGLIFGSTSRDMAADWQARRFPQRKWTLDGRVRELIAELPRTPMLRVLFNPAPLVAAIPPQRRDSPEQLFNQLLALDEVRAVAADLSRDKTSLSLDVSCAFSAQTGGIASVFSRPPTASRNLGIFPADFIGVGRIGWPSAAGFVNAAYRVLDRIDPDIGAEYRAELSEFKTETGVDFEKDLLANLAGEVAFGARVNFTKPNPIAWGVVCPLTDAARFGTQLDALLKHFDVPVQRKQSHGMSVLAGKLAFPFVMAAGQERFIIADSTFTLGELARLAADAGPTPRDPAHAALLEQTHSLNSGCVLVNLGTLGKSIGPMLAATGPAQPLLSRGSVGLAITGNDQRSHMRLTWNVGAAASKSKPAGESLEEQRDALAAGESTDPLDVLAAAIEGVGGTLSKARGEAQRAVLMSNMRNVGQGLYIYAQNNKGRFPMDLGELVKENMITPQLLGNPYDNTGPATVAEIAEKSHFVYRAGLSTNTDPREIVLAERRAHNGEGASFLCVDGHVEFIAEPKASELIAKIVAGDASVIP